MNGSASWCLLCYQDVDLISRERDIVLYSCAERPKNARDPPLKSNRLFVRLHFGSITAMSLLSLRHTHMSEYQLRVSFSAFSDKLKIKNSIYAGNLAPGSGSCSW